jgi:hypothetical protein
MMEEFCEGRRKDKKIVKQCDEKKLMKKFTCLHFIPKFL